MIKNGQYQYDLVEKLSFIRNGGTPEELRAAEILKAEIENAGGTCHFEEFKIPACTIEKCTLKVIAPFEREVTCYAHGLSGNLPEGGVDLDFFYAGAGTEENYYGMTDLSDKIVLIDNLSYDAYKILAEKKAAAFINIISTWFDKEIDVDFLVRPLRTNMLENGKIPCMAITAYDATNLVRDGAQRVHVELQQTEFENTSRNVVADIPGTEKPEEVIVLTAHYDSVLVGNGSWDNATGSATIMYLYHKFLKNPVKRTLRFIWCGTEEQGLYGSKAYVEQHEKELSSIKFCYNFDMCGTVLGSNTVIVTGGDDLKNYAEQYCRELGVPVNLRVSVHSSDSAPFADKGIPSIGLSRMSSTAKIHTRYDQMFPLSADALAITGDLAEKFVTRTGNSYTMPVGTGMPDNMKKELDKYFGRDKVPYKPAEAKTEEK